LVKNEFLTLIVVIIGYFRGKQGQLICEFMCLCLFYFSQLKRSNKRIFYQNLSQILSKSIVLWHQLYNTSQIPTFCHLLSIFRIMKLILLISLFFIAFAQCEEEVKSPFVVGGVDAHILDHPYMAGIHVNWRGQGYIPFCGSTIINRRSLLTVSKKN
jgi:hypothetical protein